MHSKYPRDFVLIWPFFYLIDAWIWFQREVKEKERFERRIQEVSTSLEARWVSLIPSTDFLALMLRRWWGCLMKERTSTSPPTETSPTPSRGSKRPRRKVWVGRHGNRLMTDSSGTKACLKISSAAMRWKDGNVKLKEFQIHGIFPLQTELADPWIIPIIQGFVEIETCVISFEDEVLGGSAENVFSRPEDVEFQLCLLSRRSRFRAGQSLASFPVSFLGWIFARICSWSVWISGPPRFFPPFIIPRFYVSRAPFFWWSWQGHGTGGEELMRMDTAPIMWKPNRFAGFNLSICLVPTYVPNKTNKCLKKLHSVSLCQMLQFTNHIVSFVQVRGSVPLYWSQTGIKYKPPPRIEKGQQRSFHHKQRFYLLL